MATLYLISEDMEHYEIGDRPLVVGRGLAADVKVEDDALSRRHFMVLREGEDYVIEDLNSRNGTWLGSRRVLAALLRHNDRVLAGHTHFLFKQRETATAYVPQPLGPHGTVVLGMGPEEKHATEVMAV